MIFQTILMYLILCTLCLIFEVSLKKLYFLPETNKTIAFSALKTIVIVITSTLISFLLLKYVLIRFNFTFILPFFIILSILSFSLLFELINKKMFELHTSDFVLCFISIFIATSEGTSLLNSLLIGITSVSCYYLVLYVLFCIDKQNSSVIKATSANIIPLLLLALATIILASYSWDVSWLSIRFF